MMDKKAFEIQFNWIFVLVAGAAILLFFAVIVIKQKNISEISTKTTVLKSVESIIIGTGVSTDTTSIISIPNSNVEISCSRVSLGGVSKTYQNLVLFAPSLVKGDRLIMQTMSFSAPYRSTNMLYVTSPHLRYILIGKTSLANEVNKSLPSALKKEFHQAIPEIKNENNYKVRFVAFNDIDVNGIGLSKFENIPDSDVTAVKITGDIEKGTIEFLQKNGNSWLSKGVSAYIGKQSLVGAVYADTLEAYECNMRNVFSKLKLVTKIHIDRTNELKLMPGSQLKCTDFYTKALAELNKIYAAASAFSNENADAIVDSARLLSNENKNTQVYSCPLIY